MQVDNKFAFGSDDELGDPSELIRRSVQEKKTPAQKKAERDEARRQKAKEEEAAKKAAAAAAAAKEVKPAGGDRGRGGRGRGGPPRGDRPPRPPRAEGDFSPRERTEGGEFRGRGRGRGAPRGDRPFRGRGAGRPVGERGEENKEVGDENTPPQEGGDFRRGGFRGGRGRGGPRQFDRQSGSDKTGVRPQEKKDGHGKGNWGDQEDQIAAETEEIKVEEPETPPAPREKTAEELEAEAREAEYAKMKTLAEYRATIQKEEAKFNTRKAGEGVEENFGKLVPIAKKEHSADDAHEVVIQSKENKKKIVETGFRFAEASRGGRFDDDKFGRGERGGRGGPRGGRGRGGNTGSRGGSGGQQQRTGGGRSDQFRADISSANDFPSLG